MWGEKRWCRNRWMPCSTRRRKRGKQCEEWLLVFQIAADWIASPAIGDGCLPVTVCLLESIRNRTDLCHFMHAVSADDEWMISPAAVCAFKAALRLLFAANGDDLDWGKRVLVRGESAALIWHDAFLFGLFCFLTALTGDCFGRASNSCLDPVWYITSLV